MNVMMLGRLYVRYMQQSERWLAALRAEEMDAEYDAGEWSGPAHNRIQDELNQQMLQEFAHKMGTLPSVVTNAHIAYMMAWDPIHGADMKKQREELTA